MLAFLDDIRNPHAEVDTTVSVRGTDDGSMSEFRSWLDRNESSGPIWTAIQSQWKLFYLLIN